MSRGAESAFASLQERIARCVRCPRLIRHCRQVARTKRRADRDFEYWGKPVPAFGSPSARLLIVGLAPAAHGANRTGRMFTGDSSGEFLYAALYRFGFCSQPHSRDRRDGLQLNDAAITAALRCAPPQNKPAPREKENCLPYLIQELRLLTQVRVVVALGQIAWTAVFRARKESGLAIPSPRPKFAHGAACLLDERVTLLGSYHPSRQNTQTGRLTAEMFDSIFQTARTILEKRDG